MTDPTGRVLLSRPLTRGWCARPAPGVCRRVPCATGWPGVRVPCTVRVPHTGGACVPALHVVVVRGVCVRAACTRARCARAGCVACTRVRGAAHEGGGAPQHYPSCRPAPCPLALALAL